MTTTVIVQAGDHPCNVEVRRFVAPDNEQSELVGMLKQGESLQTACWEGGGSIVITEMAPPPAAAPETPHTGA